jgi:hypothetical protein
MVHDRRSGCGSSPPICSVDQRDDAIDARSKFERVSRAQSAGASSPARATVRAPYASRRGRSVRPTWGGTRRHSARPSAIGSTRCGRSHWKTMPPTWMLGEPGRRSPEQKALVDEDPLHERTCNCWCWLSLPLRAKATFGDVSRALDVEPSPELRRLHAHILERESALQVPVPTRPRQAPTFRRRTERPRWNAPGSLAAGEHQWRNGHGRHPVVLEMRGVTQVAAKYCREPGAAVAATVPLTPFSPRFGELQSGWLPVGNWQWRTYRRG